MTAGGASEHLETAAAAGEPDGAAPPLTPQERRQELTVAVVAALVLVLSAVLSVDQGTVRTPIAGLRSPWVCGFRAATGIPCAGCGLTRSFVCLAHGRLRESLGFHPLGPAVAVLIYGQIPYRLWVLRRGRLPRREVRALLTYPFVLVFALMIFRWVFFVVPQAVFSLPSG